jgi:hypothetical protein
MKKQEQIQQKLEELENEIKLLKNMARNSTDSTIKIDCIKSILKIQSKIRLLKWILE